MKNYKLSQLLKARMRSPNGFSGLFLWSNFKTILKRPLKMELLRVALVAITMIVIAALLMAILLVSLLPITYMATTHYRFMRYKSVKEITANIASEFRRGLEAILATSTHIYNKTFYLEPGRIVAKKLFVFNIQA